MRIDTNNLHFTSYYKFELTGGGISEMGFTEDGQLYGQMYVIKKLTPLSTISSVKVKKAPLTSKLQYDIKFINPKGKELLFQFIQADSADTKANQFIAELKEKVPANCKWIDKLDSVAVKEDAEGKKTYNLQIMWFMKGKLFAGQGRVLQIIMNYGMLLFLTAGFTLPLFIYVLAAGCHRVTTDQNGIKIKKLTSKFFAWEEVEKIEVNKYNIIITQNGVKSDSVFLLKFKLISKQGKTAKFMIRSLEGKQFLEEMIENGKTDPSLMQIFG